MDHGAADVICSFSGAAAVSMHVVRSFPHVHGHRCPAQPSSLGMSLRSGRRFYLSRTMAQQSSCALLAGAAVVSMHIMKVLFFMCSVIICPAQPTSFGQVLRSRRGMTGRSRRPGEACRSSRQVAIREVPVAADDNARFSQHVFGNNVFAGRSSRQGQVQHM